MSALMLLLSFGASPAGAEVTVEVAPYNGVTVALVSDKPTDLSGRLWREGDAWLDDAPDAPVVIIPATATHDPYGWARDVWTSRDVWDTSELDARASGVLEKRPGALLVLRVFVAAPEWWTKENPRDTVLYGHGRHAVEVAGIEGTREYASWASEQWRSDARDALSRFVTHDEAAAYADSVVAYLLADGEDGRWRYWGAMSGRYADYSRPQRRAFIEWLREKYENDIRKLRGAWHRVVNPIPGMGPGEEKPIPAFGWDDIRIPSEEARKEHRSQDLLDPAFSPEVIDYNLFHAHQVAESIKGLANVAKTACWSRKLVGVSYGHFLDHAARPDALQTAGHAGIADVLACAEVDFLATPPTETGGVPRNSVQAHGKLYVSESLVEGGEVAPAPSPGGIAWTADQPAPGVAGNPLLWDRSSVSEVAVVVDHYSLAYMAHGNTLSRPLLTDQLTAIAQLGAPYDVWLLDDLIAGNMPDYSLYVVLNAFLLDADARSAVRRVVARDDKTVLWIFAPGAIDETLSGSAALDLTGLPIGFITREAPVRVTITDASHPLIDGVKKGLSYGTDGPSGPLFFVMPTRGDILGAVTMKLKDSEEARQWPGLVSGEFEHWTSIYSAAPNVPLPILSGIARHAGIHLYSEPGDIVRAGASTVTLHALSSGEKRVRLKRQATVIDAATGDNLAETASELTLPMQAGERRVLYIGESGRFGAQ